MPQRIQELLSALCADGGRLRHQHTRNMVRRLLQYVGLDALVLAVVYLVRFLQLTKLAPSDRIDTLYLAAVILADKFSNDDNFCDLASTICLLCGVRAEVLVTQENRILGVLLRASSLMVAPAVFRQVLRLVFEVRWGRLKQRGALAILERLSSDADDGLHPLPFDSPHDGAPEDASWADFLLPGLGSGSMLGALPALLASGMSTATELARSLPASLHASLHASPEAAPRRSAPPPLPPSPRAAAGVAAAAPPAPPAPPRAVDDGSVFPDADASAAAAATAALAAAAACAPAAVPPPPPRPPPPRPRRPSASMPLAATARARAYLAPSIWRTLTQVAGRASVPRRDAIGPPRRRGLAPRRRAADGSHAPSRRASCTLETIPRSRHAPRPIVARAPVRRPPRRRRSLCRSAPRGGALLPPPPPPPQAERSLRASRPPTRRPPRAAPPPSPPPPRRSPPTLTPPSRRRPPPSRGRVQRSSVSRTCL